MVGFNLRGHPMADHSGNWEGVNPAKKSGILKSARWHEEEAALRAMREAREAAKQKQE
jgi:hypothetical protein